MTISRHKSGQLLPSRVPIHALISDQGVSSPFATWSSSLRTSKENGMPWSSNTERKKTSLLQFQASIWLATSSHTSTSVIQPSLHQVTSDSELIVNISKLSVISMLRTKRHSFTCMPMLSNSSLKSGYNSLSYVRHRRAFHLISIKS